MHAGTEQLLAIRDGEPVDAGIAGHVTSCAECRHQLAQLGEMGEVLRKMPQLDAPEQGWLRLVQELDAPATNYFTRWSTTVAAAALLAVGLWVWGNSDNSPTLTDSIAMTDDLSPPAVTVATADRAETAPTLDELVSQSRQLEQLLRELNASTPRVMNGGTAGTIAGLQDGIAYIDYGLNQNDQLDQSQSEQLWRQRVGLMNTLVQVRGAQLQQISN